MVTIGLLALSITLLKSWFGPENCFGFIGLMGWMVLTLWIVAYATADPARRFFIGAAITGTILLVAIFLGPSTILGSVWNKGLWPTIRSFDPDPDLKYYLVHWLVFDLERVASDQFERGFSGWLSYRTSIGVSPENFNGFGNRDIQAILLIPFAIASLIGGLIVTLVRRRCNKSTESQAT